MVETISMKFTEIDDDLIEIVRCEPHEVNSIGLKK